MALYDGLMMVDRLWKIKPIEITFSDAFLICGDGGVVGVVVCFRPPGDTDIAIPAPPADKVSGNSGAGDILCTGMELRQHKLTAASRKTLQQTKHTHRTHTFARQNKSKNVNKRKRK